MRITHLFFAVLLPAVLAAGPIEAFWFNGAEINRYELSQSRYGANHPGRAELIFVTEPFLIDAQVKHEGGPGESTDVLKLNALRTFNTGIYSYRTMTSTFQPIDLDRFPRPLKTNTSVQDWCGQAFQQMNRQDAAWKVRLFSYFQSEGDQTFELSDAWLEDAFWLLIRLDPERLPTGEFPVVAGALHHRFTHRPVEVQMARGSLQSGPEQSTYTINYEDDERRLAIRFDTAFPHIIRGWTEEVAGRKTTAVLRDRIMNSDYWSHNQPEDRVKRRELGLEPIAD